MTRFHVKQSVRALSMTTTAFAALAGFAGQASALTSANTVIQNQAVATYKDAGGNSYTAQSNLAEIVVQQVYAAEILRDRAKAGAAGQTVYTSHRLTNNGNGEDTYSVSVAQLTSGDTANFDLIQVFVDANGNGVAEAGETMLTSAGGVAGSVTLAAGESVALLVAGKLPGTLADGQTAGAVLTATPGSGDVVDGTPAGAVIAGVSDTDPVGAGTNHILTTVTSNAVLSLNKSAVHDAANHRITYTITVANNGNSAAGDVSLVDPLPTIMTDHDDNPLTPDQAVQLALVPGSISSSGFGAGVGDSAAAFVASYDETTNGVDMNGDGVVGTVANAIVGLDKSLAAGSQISFQFTASYDPADIPGSSLADASQGVNNTAYAVGDTDGVPGVDGPAEGSNPNSVTITKEYRITAVDTGVGAAAGVNDGGDDDAANGVALVDTAAAGATILFEANITNTGNSVDWAELTVANSSGASAYPAGTVFQLWTGGGATQLLDSDGDGVINTPPMQPNETYKVQIRAILPSNAPTAAGPFDAVLSAVPNGDDAAAPQTVTLRTGAVTAATIDLANDSADNNAGVNKHEYTVGSTTPIQTKTGAPGETVVFDVVVQNDGGASDAFQLYAGGSWNGTDLGALPTGWTVKFVNPATNAEISSTPALISGGSFLAKAFVTIPTDAYKALADYVADVDGAGGNAAARVDGNADAVLPLFDGDYPIFVKAQSISSSAYDVIMDAVDVSEVNDFSVQADQSNQISAGGSSTTEHTVSNTGNTPKTFTLSGSSDRAAQSWGQSVEVPVLIGGVVTYVPIETVSPGDQIVVEMPDGTTTTVSAVDTGGGVIGVPLDPGQTLPVNFTVFAPTTAPNGIVNTATLTITDEEGTVTTNSILGTVVAGKLRLAKTAAIDATCAGAATADLGPDAAFAQTGNGAAPGDCVVWQVVATNTGVDSVNTVVISDTVPSFTAYQPGTLRICAGDAGTGVADACTNGGFITLSDGADADEGVVTGNDVRFNLNGANAAIPTTIISGGSVTVRFSTVVE